MFAEDLDEFLDENDFAVEAVYDGATAVVGIFLNAYGEAGLGLAGIGGTEPRFVCKAADVDADPADRTLDITGGASYAVVRGEPDGTGLMRLVLRAA